MAQPFTSLSDLLNLVTGGSSGTPEKRFWRKEFRVGAAVATTPVGDQWISLWEFNGQPSGGAPPTTIVYPTNATAGSFQQTDPGGGRSKYLISGGASVCGGEGQMILYDRLAHIGNLSGTSVSAQTVSSTITRYTQPTAAARNFAFCEIYSALGGTTRTITASYTDQAGNSGSTSQAVTIGGTGFNEAQRAIMLPVASGDTGYGNISTVTLSGSTGTAGNFGVVIGRPLIRWLCESTVIIDYETYVMDLDFEQVLAGACLALLWKSSDSALTPTEFIGSISMVEK